MKKVARCYYAAYKGEHMIIACYAGVGKSTFASLYPEDTLDLYSMPYKWILPEKEGKKEEFENVKAAPYLLLNPAFPESYLKAVLEKESQYRYVLIPTIPSVLRMLREDCGIPYILCYPQISLVAEYEERYRRRGNSENFMNIFIGQWDERISSLMEETYGLHVRLEKGEYLSDVKERIDEMIALGSADCEDVKRREKKLAELKGHVDCVMEQSCLFIKMYERPDYYFSLNMGDSDNRNWMFALGKDFYERGDHDKVCHIRIDEVQMLEAFYDHQYGSDSHYIQKAESREAVMQLLFGGKTQECGELGERIIDICGVKRKNIDGQNGRLP